MPLFLLGYPVSGIQRSEANNQRLVSGSLSPATRFRKKRLLAFVW